MARSEWQWWDRCLATLSLAIQKALRDGKSHMSVLVYSRSGLFRSVAAAEMLKNMLEQEEGISVDAPAHLCDFPWYRRSHVRCHRKGHQCTQCATEVTDEKAQLYHELRRYYLEAQQYHVWYQDWGS